MVTQLSDDQRIALQQGAGAPVYVDDPVGHARYVLIPAAAYEKVRLLLGADDFDIRETYAAQQRALGIAGWDDPVMNAYNDYDSHRRNGLAVR